MKFFSQVIIPPPQRPFSLSDSIMVLGSCFSDAIGSKMLAGGFRAMVNPFGTLYNPASLLQAVKRLDSEEMFTSADCVPMGAGAGRICSFHHHTSFARESEEEFLRNANARLTEAREFWKTCDSLFLTLGTSFVWYHDGSVVSNCLKRPAAEFTRSMLTAEESAACIRAIAEAHPEKRILLTVSPIRHLGDGAHANALSKARLLLATEAAGSQADYFPAFEIMMDELRDYRFYADDLVHPSSSAVQYLWERFMDSFVSPTDLPAIAANEKAVRQLAHRSNLK